MFLFLDKGDLFEEGNCCKCGKGDHPEWILLCDKCDKGWHASCLRPQLWVIPEGEWFCPPCQHVRTNYYLKVVRKVVEHAIKFIFIFLRTC